MVKASEVAKYLIFAYEQKTKSRFETSEIKLQKLMYFIQRESFCLTGKRMIEEDFEGWVHGPVITSLRFFFENDYTTISNENESKLNDEEKYIVNNVIFQYGMFEPWYLRNLTHEEISWKRSRVGLKDSDYGSRILKDSDIMEDAKKVRQYDHIFDMYIDEFEDVEETDDVR